MTGFDVIFLSYDEPKAEENWHRLRSFHPAAKRVAGVKGIHNALMRCAAVAEHDRFYIVDADSWVLDGFAFHPPAEDLPDRIYTWRARNAVNLILHPNGGIKLLSKNVVRSMRADAVDEVDSTESEKYFFSEVASENRFNSTPFLAWRGAFRECAKRAAGVFVESLANRERNLLIWQTRGADRTNGKWAIIGARQGAAFGVENANDRRTLLRINDVEWLRQRFAALQAEIPRTGRVVARVVRLSKAASEAKAGAARTPISAAVGAPSAGKPAQATLLPGEASPFGGAPPPQFLFLSINKRCNLRCQHCNYWTLDDDDRDRYLGSERRHAVLAEFAEMNPHGRVVTCGGESMLDLDVYFGIAQRCRALGLTNLSVVNGTRIRSAEMADRMIREGPHEISVSLNSHREELHDRTRGVNGAFAKAVEALRLLLAARARQPGSRTKIYVMGLIFDENYRELDAFYEFVLRGIGADKLKLNFLQPSFGAHPEGDDFFASHHSVDPQQLGRILDACDEKYGLRLNPVWKSQVQMYFRSVQANKNAFLGWDGGGTAEHICNTYERNIMVDHYGMARLCFSGAFPGKLLREPGDLRAFWESADPIRSAMKKCNAYCGISHSVRRVSATLKPATGMAAAGAASPVVTGAEPLVAS
jgi:MoaA/NifB/PqqE/SkfB family radical SAM enzyme